ncbi:hypothetical protein [Streptomyces sp. SPB162]|uniref:hypothetical protein n=1 Tax=Streptomyces sp. SPB162 TaxID=2940560 RepID=UPI0024049DA1|nr:hypothetical protein [Streptomyces sp. SPB162]
METYLIGGGWDEAAASLVYGPFLAAAGPVSAVACLLIDEGVGAADFGRYEAALRTVAPCRPYPVLVPPGGELDPAALDGAAALLVCGGLTPAYGDVLAPHAGLLPRVPYAGFSAGAAVAADLALVGGWRADGIPVCPEETAEDLDEITLRPGLGLVPCTVEAHAAQWGTLARLIETVARGDVAVGVAIDENTLLTVEDGRCAVDGLGRVHLVRAGETTTVRSYRAGETFTLSRVL